MTQDAAPHIPVMQCQQEVRKAAEKAEEARKAAEKAEEARKAAEKADEARKAKEADEARKAEAAKPVLEAGGQEQSRYARDYIFLSLLGWRCF